MNNTLKKLLVGFFTVLMCIATLAGCNQPDSSATSENEGDLTGSTELVEIKNAILSPGTYYTNPLTGSAADPMIVEHEGVYYLYSTGGSQLSVRSSKNLLTWSESKLIFQLSQTTWGKQNCWAPEVFEYKGKFYLFFCGKDANGIFHGSVAVCDTPDGTFKPITTDPLLNFNYSVIDLSFFEDDDGKTYIYYSKDCSTNKINGKKVSQTYGVEVSNDFTKLLTEPVLISTPSEAWELKSGGTIWNEGPIVFKENGKYYLLYSANYYQSADYAVGYCTSDAPLKFFDKPKNGSILKGNGTTITGPGHCNILRMDGEIYLTYHAHTVPPNTDHGRSLYIDKLIIKPDGTLYANGPTNTKQPLPDGINGTKKYAGAVTVTGNITREEKQNLAAVTDGIISKGLDGLVKMNDGDSVTLELGSPQKIDAIWIYSSKMHGYMPGKVDITINDQYIIKNVKFSDLLGSPATASFKNLPEGTVVSKITLTFTKAEDTKDEKQELSAISEITLVSFNK